MHLLALLALRGDMSEHQGLQWKPFSVRGFGVKMRHSDGQGSPEELGLMDSMLSKQGVAFNERSQRREAFKVSFGGTDDFAVDAVLEGCGHKTGRFLEAVEPDQRGKVEGIGPVQGRVGGQGSRAANSSALKASARSSLNRSRP